MKKSFIFVCVFSWTYSSNALAARAVEYVRICSYHGAGFHYIPGTDTCLQDSTGITKRETENGTEVGQTDLAKRVEELEAKVDALSKQLSVEK